MKVAIENNDIDKRGEEVFRGKNKLSCNFCDKGSENIKIVKKNLKKWPIKNNTEDLYM